MQHWQPAIGAAFCLALGMGMAGQFGFFSEPLAREFDLSMQAINTVPLVLLIAPAFMSPLVGALADKVSIKALLLVGSLMGMVSLIVASYQTSAWLALGCYVLFICGMAMYGPVVVNAFLIRHYQTNSGRALAIAAMGVSVASAILPNAIAWLLTHWDWRFSLRVVSWVSLIVLLVAVGLTIPKSGINKNTEADQGLPNLMHSKPFWLIGLVMAIVFSSALIVAICYPLHFKLLGFSLREAGVLMSMAAVGGMTGKILFATTIDRMNNAIITVAISIVAVQIVGFIGLTISTAFWAAALCVFLGGLGGGASIPLHPYLNSRFFENDVIGRVNGLQMPLMLPFGLVGLPLSGWVFDKTGDYNIVFWSYAVLFSGALILLLLLKSQTKLHITQ